MKEVKRNILLNPGPATTSDEVKYAMVVPDICPREEEFCQIMDSIKEDLPKVIQAGDEYTATMFTSSGTGAVEAAITSAVPRDGKLLVIDNGAYGARMVQIAERYSISLIKYKIKYGDYPRVEEIENLIHSNRDITHIAVVDHETTTGMRNPIALICELAHKNNIEVIVDCMSSYAGLPIDLSSWKAEYIISSSNKCIQGMAGLGFVIFRKNLLDKIKGNARSFYFDLYAQHQGFYMTGQMPFTPPVQVVYALRKALDLFFEETAEGRIKRYRKNYEALYDGLKDMGFEFLLSKAHQSGILLAVKEPVNPEYDFTMMHDYLYERGFTIYPGKGAKEATFRLSVLGDLYPDDISNFLQEMKNYLRKNNILKIQY
ncbi:2-aminoethylphosphonate--pyruvate transaminase [Paludibacter sp.]